MERCVKVTDESLKAIGEANHLRSLNLQGCYLITDIGLKYLATEDLKNSLVVLNLDECVRISDAGCIYLGQMVHLTVLTLSKCGVNITDSGISAISKIPNIKTLMLSWLINITDTSLFNIAKNSLNLRVLHLTGCEAITGEALHAFTDHPTLSFLTLYSCHNISWEEVMLCAFTRLNYLGLSSRINTPLPKASYKYLGFGDNRCKIYWR